MNDLYGVALGGVLGIVGGATAQFIQNRLTWKRDVRRWAADNRKEEFRELLKTLTHTATFLMEFRGTSAGTETSYKDRFTEVYGDALRSITDRIFIAPDVKKLRVYDRWTNAILELSRTKDLAAFSVSFEKIKDDIVECAMTEH